MRLAYCIFRYFPFGGLQQDFLAIVQASLRRNDQVEVYTMDWQGTACDCPIHIIPTKGISNHARAHHFARQLSSLSQTFDCVIGFNKMPGLTIYFAGDDCTKAKISQKNWLHRLNPRYRAFLKLEAAVFGRDAKAHCLFISERQQNDFQQYYQTSSSRLHLLPPYINKCFQPNYHDTDTRKKIRAELNIKENEYLILCVASYFHTKGVDRSIQAFCALPATLRANSHLVIIGKDNSAPYQKMLQSAHLKKQVHFMGARTDIAAFMWSADVFIHPARTEAAGKVLLEAMTSGLPILTTSNCGYADHVRKSQSGIVLPWHANGFDQAYLNINLANMLRSENMRQTYQAHALHYSASADWFDMPEKVCDLIHNI